MFIKCRRSFGDTEGLELDRVREERGPGVRETDRLRERETDRDRETETERQRQRET